EWRAICPSARSWRRSMARSRTSSEPFSKIIKELNSYVALRKTYALNCCQSSSS
ncbi:hypothetical protein BHE74_00038667, partial [Ensete ventricosum]